jgi:hypothetical protein
VVQRRTRPQSSLVRGNPNLPASNPSFFYATYFC